MMFDLTGRAALVTEASGGLGPALLPCSDASIVIAGKCASIMPPGSTA